MKTWMLYDEEAKSVIAVVPAEQAEAIEQLNKEMLEVLKEAHRYIFPKRGSCLKPVPSFAETEAIKVKLLTIIAKAEGVQ